MNNNHKITHEQHVPGTSVLRHTPLVEPSHGQEWN